MAVVTIQGVTRQFGTQVILEDVSLELRAREIVGLVGVNGAGKTTLFRLIAGELPPDKGNVIRARGLDIGFLRQEPDISPERTLHDEVGSVFADLLALEEKLHRLSEGIADCKDEHRLSGLMEAYERINAQFLTAGGHGFETKLNEILGGLGFTSPDYTLPMSALSGGQKCRAALAKVLLSDCRLLLLDEPTNHLDIDAVRWLEKFLAGHHGGAVIISHDRYLLDRLCDRIVEVENRKVTSFPGNYTNYARTKGVRELTQQRRFEKDTEFIKKERDFVARHIAGQRTKEAQGRRKRLERRLGDGEFVTEAPRARRPPKFAFERAESKAATPVRCDALTMRFEDNSLFTDLNFQVSGGERFGITGPNGTGKTTLLKIILGELTPVDGTVTVDPKVKIGYYAQEHTNLDPSRTVLDVIREALPELSEQDARSLLGRYLFSGDDVFKTLGQLSGGEQSRVRMVTLIQQSPDVLILDEPTNHLDIPSREVLETALLDFPGTIIAVSHDRYFLDRIVQRLLVLRREGHTLYRGSYSFYIEQLEQQRVARVVVEIAPGEESAPATPGRKKRRTKSTAKAKSKSEPSPYDRLSIDELEALIIQREAELAAIHKRFAEPAVYRDPKALAQLREQADVLSDELAAIDAAWQERVDAQ